MVCNNPFTEASHNFFGKFAIIAIMEKIYPETEQDNKNLKMHPGDVIVDGMVVPQHVIFELKKNNLSVDNFSKGELEDIIIACSKDGALVDDHEGGTLRDKMLLTETERSRQRNKKSWVERCCPEGHDCEEHRKKIKEERKARKSGHHVVESC